MMIGLTAPLAWWCFHCIIGVFAIGNPTIDESLSEGYSNPCEEFGTADKLNSLFYYDNTTPDGKCPGGSESSFRCSGVFIHGQDCGSGTSDNLLAAAKPSCTLSNTAAAKFLNDLLYPPPNYTIGTASLNSPMCPTRTTLESDREVPFWCPAPVGIDVGSVSFTYLRHDISLPISLLRHWEETGSNLYTGNPERPNAAWPGPGIIFLPDDGDDHEGDASFWKNRLRAIWPHNGVTLYRANCLMGPSWFQMLLGFGGSPFPFAFELDSCPAVLPSSWNSSYCPESAFESVEDYYNYTFSQIVELSTNWKNGMYYPGGELSELYKQNATAPIDSIPALPNATQASVFKLIAEEILNWMMSSPGSIDEDTLSLYEEDPTSFAILLSSMIMLNGPNYLSCGIPSALFDDLYVPAQNYSNWPEWRRNISMISSINGSTPVNGAPNEALIKSWEGVSFGELGSYLVFYADETEGSVEAALGYAEEFYAASQLDGEDPIRIPVVFVNQNNLFKNGDERPTVFECVVGIGSNNITTPDDNVTGNTPPNATSAGYSMVLPVVFSGCWLLGLMCCVFLNL